MADDDREATPDGGAIGRPATARATPSADVDAYIAAFPSEVGERLTAVRGVVGGRLGGGQEVVRYGMPAVMLGGRYGLHFAGWKKHIALYPVPVFEEPLESEVAPYRSGKDTVAFRHAHDLPLALVGRICDAVVQRREGASASAS